MFFKKMARFKGRRSRTSPPSIYMPVGFMFGNAKTLFFFSLVVFSFQELAAVLGVAGVDALSVLHQPAQQRRAENHRDGVRHFPYPALSCHQVRVGRLARLGGHPVHHPLQGQGTH